MRFFWRLLAMATIAGWIAVVIAAFKSFDAAVGILVIVLGGMVVWAFADYCLEKGKARSK